MSLSLARAYVMTVRSRHLLNSADEQDLLDARSMLMWGRKTYMRPSSRQKAHLSYNKYTTPKERSTI